MRIIIFLVLQSPTLLLMRHCVHSALNLNLSNTELTLFCVMIVSLDVVPSRANDTKERPPQKGAVSEIFGWFGMFYERF